MNILREYEYDYVKVINENCSVLYTTAAKFNRDNYIRLPNSYMHA